MVDHVKEIRSAIVDKPPFYASTYTLPADNHLTKLGFSKGGELCVVDLLNLSDQDVQSLSDACDPASFGLDKKDVLDPSYRKALKMDKEKFYTNFELTQKEVRMDIIGEIKNQLWEAADGAKFIRPEIYKLNVYGNDSFFKKHKDTPRGVDMVGSLVVAFPTPECEGGELILSKDDKSWTWDSAKILKEAPERTFAYIAFYSDTDHEVLPVTKGSRVTITYNLYVESDDENQAMCEEDSFKTALSSALHDSTFLPKGGYLAFGLRYMYPVDPEKTKLHTLKDSLKGSDAMIRRVCDHLGLNVELKTVYTNIEYGYEEHRGDFVIGHIIAPDDLNEQFEDTIYRTKGAKKLVKIDAKGAEENPAPEDDSMGELDDDDEEIDFTGYNNPRTMPVLWINEQAEHSEFKTPHVRYGNEASLGYYYAYICLMAKVDVPDNREKVVPQKRRKLD